MDTPPPDYKSAYTGYYKSAHIAVTESLTSVDTDTEPETDIKPETTVQASTDSDTISVNLADVSSTADDTPETVESIVTAAADDSDTVSVNLAETESASATAPVVPAVVPPALAFAPVPLAAGIPVVALPPPPPPVVDSDSENEMAESQSNTQFAPQKFKGLINENDKDWIRQLENYCQHKEFNADKKMALFKVLLVDSAAVWYDSLSEDNTDTWAHVKTAFETRYNPPEFMKYQHAK